MSWHFKNKNNLGPLSAIDSIFNDRQISDQNSFPDFSNSPNLIIASDYCRSKKLDCLSFLLADPLSINAWNDLRLLIRFEHGLSGREIGYKKLNDSRQRRALTPFLKNVNTLKGILITVLIDNSLGTLFNEPSTEDSEYAQLLKNEYKKSVLERVLRTAHFCAFFIAGLCSENQNILWITDEDDMFANEKKHRVFLNTFAIISSNLLNYNLGHLRLGTSKADDGSMLLKDLLSIADLSSGAIVASFDKIDLELIGKNILFPVIENVPWKPRNIVGELFSFSKTSGLKKICVLIDRSKSAFANVELLNFHLPD